MWQGSHTQVAIDTQSTFGYRQNVIVRALTYAAPHYRAIIEENFPAAAMTSPHAFYDAVGDDARYKANLKAMIDSCARFIDMDRIDVVPTSEYNWAGSLTGPHLRPRNHNQTRRKRDMPLHPQVEPMIELLNQSMAGLPATDVMEISTVREVSLAAAAAEPHAGGPRRGPRIPGPAGEIPVRIYTPEGSGPLPAGRVLPRRRLRALQPRDP